MKNFGWKKDFILAKSKLQFKRNIVDKLSVKGVLSEDGTFITYTDENDVEQDVVIIYVKDGSFDGIDLDEWC